jgi:hypothetical protein
MNLGGQAQCDSGNGVGCFCCNCVFPNILGGGVLSGLRVLFLHRAIYVLI